VKDRRAEQTPSAVPERAPQDGEIRARWAWVEPVVWTERMLATLETGIEGGKWFRLTAQCLLHHGWPVLLKTGACCGLPIFFEVTTNWRAGCQKLACPVRREGRPESSSLPLSLSASRRPSGSVLLFLGLHTQNNTLPVSPFLERFLDSSVQGGRKGRILTLTLDIFWK